MRTWNAEILHKAELILGEGAHWHEDWKKFLYVDIEGKKVGWIDPETKETAERNVDRRIGTVVPANNNKLVIALQGSIEELDFNTGERKLLTEIENDKPANRCNEGKCDPAGRLWIGTMEMEAGLNKGTLYCFDGLLKRKIGNRSISNGICWSKDSRTMYYIDSFDYDIKAYDFDRNNGTILNGRVIIKIEGTGLLADGMTIDNEGMLWVAIWGGACVRRYNPADGTIIGKVMVDAPNVTGCAFGGKGMRQLFITTARSGLTEKIVEQYPLSGSLFFVNTGIMGLPGNTYTFN